MPFRSSGVGASESSILMGVNPYETLENLFLKKTGQIPAISENNEFTSHGIRNEDLARQMLNIETGSDFQPICIRHEKYPFIIASLDGFWKNSVLEIKCPFKLYSFLNQKKKIPDYYYCQIQHHLLTSKAEIEYFMLWFEYKKHIIKVLPDLKYMEELEKRLIKFWNFVERKEFPKKEEFEKK